MAQAAAEEDSWEDAGVQELQKLSIKQTEQPQQPSQGPGNTGTEAKKPAPAIAIDPAIVEALQKGREADRKTITDIENMVIKFIGDTSRELLEFPVSYGTYQKMLAHRVAQAYGLQTSTVDYEDGHGRVVGSRTKDTRLRKVKLVKMDLSAPEFQLREGTGDRAGGLKVLFRRPGGPDHGRVPTGPDFKAGNAPSMKEREEDYNRARERLGLGMGEAPAPPQGMRLNPAQSLPAGRGSFPAGRGGPAMQGRDMGGRGRGRKAVFRDRDRELQDPDYVRGFSRDGAQAANYDNSGYDMDGYQEMAPLQQWGSGQYRLPPPPPPPHSGGAYHAGAGPNSKGQPGPSAQVPSNPGGMVMYPGGAQGMAAAGPPQMAGMARPAYPAGMPMAPYPMSGYPGPMAYPGMQQQAAIYAAQGMGHPYASSPAAYGYIEAAGGQEMSGMAAGSHPQGAYPVYTTGYAMYPQHMAAMGGVRAMGMPGMAQPAPGMEHMYYAAGPAGQYAYPMMPAGGGGGGGEGKQQQQQHGRGQSNHGHSGAAQHSEVGGA